MEQTFVLTNFVLQIIGFAIVWHIVYAVITILWTTLYGDDYSYSSPTVVLRQLLILIPWAFALVFGILILRVFATLRCICLGQHKTTFAGDYYNCKNADDLKGVHLSLNSVLYESYVRYFPKSFYKNYEWGVFDKCKEYGLIDPSNVNSGIFYDTPLFKLGILDTMDSTKMQLLSSIWSNGIKKMLVHGVGAAVALVVIYTLLFTSVIPDTIGFVLSPITHSLAQDPAMGKYMMCPK